MAPEKLHEVTGSYTMSRKARVGKGENRAIESVRWDRVVKWAQNTRWNPGGMKPFFPPFHSIPKSSQTRTWTQQAAQRDFFIPRF